MMFSHLGRFAALLGTVLLVAVLMYHYGREMCVMRVLDRANVYEAVPPGPASACVKDDLAEVRNFRLIRIFFLFFFKPNGIVVCDTRAHNYGPSGTPDHPRLYARALPLVLVCFFIPLLYTLLFLFFLRQCSLSDFCTTLFPPRILLRSC